MQTTIIIATTVLIFATFFVIFFRADVRKLFPRIKTIGTGGVSLSEAQSKSTETPKVTFEQQFDTHSRSPVQISKEEQIRRELEERGIRSDEERVKLLIRALATTIISADCERLSLVIFGSQLELLVDINSKQDGVKLHDIETWYSQTIQPQYPNLKDYAFGTYIEYLIAEGLLVQHADVVKVTQFAKEFMQYLVKTGKTHRRIN